MTQISVAEAAKLAGRDRKTLYRDIKSGRLSATVSATGDKQVDVAELSRVYGPLRQYDGNGDSRKTVSMPHVETASATAEMLAKLTALEVENAQLKERLIDKETHINDMRNSLRLLEHKKQDLDESPWWKLW